MASSTRRDTVCTPDQVTIIIIYKFLLYTSFGHYSDFIACFGLLIPKICGNTESEAICI